MLSQPFSLTFRCPTRDELATLLSSPPPHQLPTPLASSPPTGDPPAPGSPLGSALLSLLLPADRAERSGAAGRAGRRGAIEHRPAAPPRPTLPPPRFPRRGPVGAAGRSVMGRGMRLASVLVLLVGATGAGGWLSGTHAGELFFFLGGGGCSAVRLSLSRRQRGKRGGGSRSFGVFFLWVFFSCWRIRWGRGELGARSRRKRAEGFFWGDGRVWDPPPPPSLSPQDKPLGVRSLPQRRQLGINSKPSAGFLF